MNIGTNPAPVHYALTARIPVEAQQVLSPGALGFVSALHCAFEDSRQQLLGRRKEVRAHLDEGWLPDFLPETADVRAADWRVAPPPADLVDRRVEITGPVDRKMVINGLNAGANVYMADFEDSTSPTWENVVAGQLNLRDAVAGSIAFEDTQRGKRYAVGDKPAVLIVRPRGWHLDEDHMRVDGVPVSAALFDFGLFLFNNAETLRAKGTGPYFYLPKLESHLEARLWAQVFAAAEEKLGLPHGTVRATVLVETILAAFEMDEILFELKDYIVGLNCGRWDYIFSFIKKFRTRPDFVLPDRGQVTMECRALRAYSRLLIKTCHRRGAHAMGGMAAQIPIKDDAAANDLAFGKVRADKEREARDGHDGSWVAHPGLVPVAREVFDALMPGPNQLDRALNDFTCTQEDLLAFPKGHITNAGLRQNVRVCLAYLEAWLRGTGCVPIHNLMEDAATAEISRAQLWQWIRHGATTDDGDVITAPRVRTLISEETAALRADLPDSQSLDAAAELLSEVTLSPDFEDFITVPAYHRLLTTEQRSS